MYYILRGLNFKPVERTGHPPGVLRYLWMATSSRIFLFFYFFVIHGHSGEGGQGLSLQSKPRPLLRNESEAF